MAGSCRRRILSRKSSDGFPNRYDDSYNHRPRSEHGASTVKRSSRTSHYSSSPEHSKAVSDYGGTRRESRYSTMRTDATGDWQYFGPNEVPVQRQSLKRESPVRSSYSDYYGPAVDSRKVYRSSQSDYNAPTSRRPKPALSDFGGSTHSLKIVRKTSTPKNGYVSSSDESFNDPYPPRSMSLPRKPNKNSLVKKTVRRTFKRRDSSPKASEVQRISVQEPQTPERISVFMNEADSPPPPVRYGTLSSGRERSQSLGRDRAPGKVHTIQTLTREKSTNQQSTPASHSLDHRMVTHNSNQQPLHVSAMTRKEVLTTQAPPPITSGHTTLTFSGHSVPSKDETYVNKVFQQNDQPVVKAQETFKSGVIQIEKETEPQVIYKDPPPSNDLHKTRINFVTSELPAVQHHSKIEVQPLQQRAVSRSPQAITRKLEPVSRERLALRTVPQDVLTESYVVSTLPQAVSRVPQIDYSRPQTIFKELQTVSIKPQVEASAAKPVEYVTIRPEERFAHQNHPTELQRDSPVEESLPQTTILHLSPLEHVGDEMVPLIEPTQPRKKTLVSQPTAPKPQDEIMERLHEIKMKPSNYERKKPEKTNKHTFIVKLNRLSNGQFVKVDEENFNEDLSPIQQPTRDEPDIGKPPRKAKEDPPKVERVEEIPKQKAAPPSESSDDEEESKTKTVRKTTQKVIHMQPKPIRSNDEVEEITETTIHGFYADMPPDRQKTFSELTKTALGRTEQTTGNFFNNGDSRSLITEAWHTNRPKTEQEIIDEITSRTTSEVVKRSILDGVDYKFIPTHSKELEEIQRKRKEFEAEMERQRKIREIKAGIRQNIHVDHNEEDLVGDYSMSITDDGQIDLDTIEEHVDLGISASGVAAIAVKVTAERILPVDVDNNLWRKSSVTVTRTIEIDLMRCEETRLLYDKILAASRRRSQQQTDAHKSALNSRAEEAARHGYPPQQRLAHELDATDTYKIFSALMNVTGEADNEDLGILSENAAKHFLSGDYVKNPKVKEEMFGAQKPYHTDIHEERVISQSTTQNSRANAGDGRVETEGLYSVNPEKIRSTRSSEYYRRKMQDSPPPPEFVTSMFDGQTLADKFDAESSKRNHADNYNRSRSLSPVGQMTAHQREYYERSRDGTGSSRGHQPSYRQEVKMERRNFSPPPYTARVVKEEHREVRTSRDSDHASSPQHQNSHQTSNEKPEPQVLFSERVSGVKQRANEMRRNNEMSASRESLSHSPTDQHAAGAKQRDFNANINNNNDSDMHTKINRRRVVSRDNLLFGARGDDVSATDDERVARHESQQNKKNYESGYYSDVSKKHPTTDINRMLHDAERYFKKTATERELTRSEGGYYSPRYNKQGTRQHSDHSDHDHSQVYRHQQSYEPDDGIEHRRHETVRHKGQPEDRDTYYERNVEWSTQGNDRSTKSEPHHRREERRRVQYRDDVDADMRDNLRVDVDAPYSRSYHRYDEGISSSPEEERDRAWSPTERAHSQARVDSVEFEVDHEDYPEYRSNFRHEIPADDYMSVKTRRSQIKKQMDDTDINSEDALANQRQAMLGGSRYVPRGRSSHMVTTRRSTNSRRY